MNKENFLSEALCQHQDVLSYFVSRRLAERFSNTAIVEGQEYAFDIEKFERDGQCDIVCVNTLHNQIKTEWMGVGEKIESTYENAWLSVLWKEQLLDVVLLTYVQDGSKDRYHWIIAESPDIAEEFLRAVCEWTSPVKDEIMVFDEGWCSSQKLYEAIKTASFDDLVLPEALKRDIVDDFTRFLASRSLYEQYGIPWKRGVMLTGPPGNGKTHMVKAIVNHLNLPCLYVKNLDSGCGVATGIRRVFNRARRQQPCLIVMEDIDSLIPKNARSFFLNEMDGFAQNTGVIVLATTNYPERLDPAIIDRPSRFDRKYHFNLPQSQERLQYLQTKLHDDAKLSEAGCHRVAELTESFSFAYLKELVLSSLVEWIDNPVRGRMDVVMIKRAAILRGQMKTAQASGTGEISEEEK